jgi:hypothetical protein
MSSNPSSPAPVTPATRVQPSPSWFRREPGLALCLGSVVPVILGVALPAGARVPCFALATLMALAGLVLIVRTEMSRGPRTPAPHDD